MRAKAGGVEEAIAARIKLCISPPVAARSRKPLYGRPSQDTAKPMIRHPFRFAHNSRTARL